MKDLKGYIHSFETFGSVDGPGIRFILFFQGCALQCQYCHNRDSWQMNVGDQMSVSEVMTEVLKYREFFEASGGGVTASGGEPLLQLDFLTEFFKACKKEGLHTTLDTCGNVSFNEKTKAKFDELMSVTDLVLYDVKLMDEAGHKQLTGFTNKRVLDFGQYISDSGVPMWIRRVLVPGLTDNEEDLKRTAAYIRSLKTVEKIQILPYHNLGESKWKEMGLTYPLEGQRAPTPEEVEWAETILKGS